MGWLLFAINDDTDYIDSMRILFTDRYKWAIIMKTILILANNDGGIWNFRRELCEELVKAYNVFFCVPEGPYIDSIVSLGCTYIPCFFLARRSINPFMDLKLLVFYKKIITKLKPDVVLTYTIKPNVYGGIVCGAKTPYLSNITGLGTSIENGGFLSKVCLFLYKIGLRHAECVFFQNSSNSRFFIEKGVVTGKTQLIPGSGVNLKTHKEEPYPSSNRLIKFLFVGRIMKDKGIDELLDAMERVHCKRNDVMLDIVGPCDENYDEKLRKVESMGFIHYYGLQKDVHSFFSACHCTILPSYHEGTANVLLESSATGRPVIATRIPGCQEIIDEGDTGFCCEVRNVDSLVSAINNFLSLNNEQMKAMGKAARKKVEKEYNRDIVVNAYIKEISLVIG